MTDRILLCILRDSCSFIETSGARKAAIERARKQLQWRPTALAVALAGGAFGVGMYFVLTEMLGVATGSAHQKIILLAVAAVSGWIGLLLYFAKSIPQAVRRLAREEGILVCQRCGQAMLAAQVRCAECGWSIAD